MRLSINNQAVKEIENEIKKKLYTKKINESTIEGVSAEVSDRLGKSLGNEYLLPSGDDPKTGVKYDPDGISIGSRKEQIVKRVAELVESKRSIFSKLFGTTLITTSRNIRNNN